AGAKLLGRQRCGERQRAFCSVRALSGGRRTLRGVALRVGGRARPRDEDGGHQEDRGAHVENERRGFDEAVHLFFSYSTRGASNVFARNLLAMLYHLWNQKSSIRSGSTPRRR